MVAPCMYEPTRIWQEDIKHAMEDINYACNYVEDACSLADDWNWEWSYDSHYQCGPRCLGTSTNRCMQAVHLYPNA